jgi:predicted component of type VI protein secretion system
MDEETRSEVCVEEPVEDEAARKRRIKMEAEKLSESVFSKETRDHLVRAGTEIILAVDSMIPRDKIPEDVKEHYLAAKKETLLLVKSLLDAQVTMVQDLQEKKEAPPEPGPRKIKLD